MNFIFGATMIKVLGKSFALLEFVAVHDGMPVLPSEAAAALRLNHATTVRILRELLKLGYLSQISRNKGYVLGPMAQSVFGRNVYRQKLIRVAAPLVAQCADATGESVVLAVMQGTRRYVLLHENRNPGMQIDISGLYYEDLYITATGRVLLASSESSVIEAVVKRMGLPDKRVWPKAGSLAGLKRELAEIRRAGYTAFHSSQTDLFITACPIFKNDTCVAALGVSFPEEKYSKKKHSSVLNSVKRDAAEIMKALVVIETAG